MKHRIVDTLQKYLINPPIKFAVGTGLPLPGYALLETKGRKTGKPRRTPVGNGRIGNQFWLVAEHGMKAGYVRNIERRETRTQWCLEVHVYTRHKGSFKRLWSAGEGMPKRNAWRRTGSNDIDSKAPNERRQFRPPRTSCKVIGT